MTENIGAFVLVLHSHLPYVRMAGGWPHGEEMLHEAMAETYIPLLNALNELLAEGYHPRLTLGLTPVLLEQMADAGVQAHFERYLEERLALIGADVGRLGKEGDRARLKLAEWYQRGYVDLLKSFRERYQGNLVIGFRDLQDAGVLDILTCAATHGYLPLMERNSTIYGQLRTGYETTRRHLGRSPQGVWLPECGYRPAYTKEMDDRGYVKPGLESFLAAQNLRYFFTDSHVIEGRKLTGKVAGDVIGPYGVMPQRKWVEPLAEDDLPRRKRGTTFRPYYVHSDEVAVFARDEGTGLQVWSASQGYPGDPVYREFHRKDDHSGLQYWRVTGPKVELGDKALYDPEVAFGRVYDHTDHFVALVEERLREYQEETGQYGCITNAYDTELYGHWWFEGILWLKEVLRRLERHNAIDLTTADAYLKAHPPTEVLDLPESSWGTGGGHWTWLNPETEWLWPLIHNAERQMEALVERYPDADGEMLELLNQATRELLLLESSDWSFLITTGQAQEYATSRLQGHIARFQHLVSIAQRGEIGDEERRFLHQAQELDNPFPDIDYRDFQAREGAGK